MAANKILQQHPLIVNVLWKFYRTERSYDKKSNIWEIIDVCSEQYIFTTALYLLSMLPHSYNILINRDVEAPVHGKYVLDGLNTNDKRFITILMTTVKIPGAYINNLQMVMHTTMRNTYISLVRIF